MTSDRTFLFFLDFTTVSPFRAIVFAVDRLFPPFELQPLHENSRERKRELGLARNTRLAAFGANAALPLDSHGLFMYNLGIKPESSQRS